MFCFSCVDLSFVQLSLQINCCGKEPCVNVGTVQSCCFSVATSASAIQTHAVLPGMILRSRVRPVSARHDGQMHRIHHDHPRCSLGLAYFYSKCFWFDLTFCRFKRRQPSNCKAVIIIHKRHYIKDHLECFCLHYFFTSIWNGSVFTTFLHP